MTLKTSLLPCLYKSLMPSLCQLDSRSMILKEKGRAWCGPVAVSNTLVHLAKVYYQTLLPPQGDLSEIEAQVALVEKLADCMNLDESGATPIDVMSGLEKYVVDRGYKIKIEFKGWRDGSIYKKVEDKPNIDWTMQGVIGTSNAILNIGWYETNLEKSEYKRHNGHFVSEAGFLKSPKENFLIIHDPSPISESIPKVINFSQISNGVFLSWKDDEKNESYPNIDATNYLEVNGINIPSRIGDAQISKAVLDGAFVFDVQRK